MHSVNLYAPIPSHDADALPVCPAPHDCKEPLICIDGRDKRIQYAGHYHAAGLQGALAQCYVRASVFEKLQDAIAFLPEPYTLLIFDAFRPLAVQKALYEEYADIVRRQHPTLPPDEIARIVDDFVALPVRNPARPAPHATGGAVDLTLCYEGVAIDMGTKFDDFTEMASTCFFETAGRDGEAQCFRNARRLLYNMMIRVGFVNYSAEWWHFSYGDRLWARVNGVTPIYGLAALPHGAQHMHSPCKKQSSKHVADNAL